MKNRRLTIAAVLLLALASLFSAGAVFEQQFSLRTVSIADLATTSSTLHVQPWAHHFGVCTDAAFDGAALAIHVSTDGTTFVALEDEGGAAVSLTIGASNCIGVGAEVAASIAPWQYARLVSSGAQSGAASVVTVTMKR